MEEPEQAANSKHITRNRASHLLFFICVASFFALFDLRCFGMSILPLSAENSKQYEEIMYTKIEGENCAKLLIEIGR